MFYFRVLLLCFFYNFNILNSFNSKDEIGFFGTIVNQVEDTFFLNQKDFSDLFLKIDTSIDIFFIDISLLVLIEIDKFKRYFFKFDFIRILDIYFNIMINFFRFLKLGVDILIFREKFNTFSSSLDFNVFIRVNLCYFFVDFGFKNIFFYSKENIIFSLKNDFNILSWFIFFGFNFTRSISISFGKFKFNNLC